LKGGFFVLITASSLFSEDFIISLFINLFVLIETLERQNSILFDEAVFVNISFLEHKKVLPSEIRSTNYSQSVKSCSTKNYADCCYKVANGVTYIAQGLRSRCQFSLAIFT